MRRVAFLLYALALSCRGNAGAADDHDMAAPAEHPDDHAAAAAQQAMTGMTAEDLHLIATFASRRPRAFASISLCVTRWHQHINWCRPGGSLAEARRRWRETKDGRPVFGPKSPIATAFSGDDPWNAHQH